MAKRGLCERLRPALHSLCCESTVVSLTLLSVLAITGEILIEFGIITEPPDSQNKETSANNSPQSQAVPSDTSSTDEREALKVVQDVFHYLSLAIAALFFVEMVVKIAAFRKKFFMQPWQVLDLAVVCISLAVEIAFEVNGRLSELEVCTFIIICRLWRIPHACNIRAQSVQRDLEQELEVWKAGASKMQERCSSLDARNSKQKDRIERLEREIAVLKTELNESKSNARIRNESESVPNGSVPRDGTSSSRQYLAASAGRTANKPPPKPARGHVRVESGNTTDGSSIGKGGSRGGEERDTEEDTVEEDDGDEENRRNYFRSGSESSLSCHAVEQEVQVQIEDEAAAAMTSQKEGDNLDGTTPVQIRQGEESTEVYYDNKGYVPDLEQEDFQGEILHEIDGARTYRSADGIPMTDL